MEEWTGSDKSGLKRVVYENLCRFETGKWMGTMPEGTLRLGEAARWRWKTGCRALSNKKEEKAKNKKREGRRERMGCIPPPFRSTKKELRDLTRRKVNLILPKKRKNFSHNPFDLK